ncbi:hypothetical protein [Desulfonema magnum]|nr:hypothetical protein [Desulfonema magnum]
MASALPSPQLARLADADLPTHGQNPVPSPEGQKADTVTVLVVRIG